MIHAECGEDREGQGFLGLLGNAASYRDMGFVSGYRFSDTVSSSVSDAPLGVAARQVLFSRAVSLGQGFGFSR
jgi:hypothetical protein